LVEVFSGFADDDHVLFGEDIMEDLDEFLKIEFVNESLDIAKLIGDVVTLAIIDEPKSADVGFEFQIDRIRCNRQCLLKTL
jgi:hypothetical protein